MNHKWKQVCRISSAHGANLSIAIKPKLSYRKAPDLLDKSERKMLTAWEKCFKAEEVWETCMAENNKNLLRLWKPIYYVSLAWEKRDQRCGLFHFSIDMAVQTGFLLLSSHYYYGFAYLYQKCKKHTIKQLVLRICILTHWLYYLSLFLFCWAVQDGKWCWLKLLLKGNLLHGNSSESWK